MKSLLLVGGVSVLMIGCGASGLGQAKILDRNQHHGRIQLEGEPDGAMERAQLLMTRHCGAGYAVDGVTASGAVEYHCASQRDIDAELPPVLAHSGR